MSFRRAAGVVLLGLVCVILQSSLLRVSGGIFASVPNLSLALVLYLAFYEVSAIGAVLAFLVGLQLDLFSGMIIGPAAASFVLIYGLIACFAQRIFVESNLSVFFAALFSSLASSSIYVGLTIGNSRDLSDVIGSIITESIYTALLSPLVFWSVRLLFLGKERASWRFNG